MTLGFPDHLTKWELSDAYREAYLKDQRVVPHVVVDDGPVLQNIMLGEDVDVTMFPAPKWHEKDGGRYIGTGTYSITRDPEENWLNAGAYRAQVHDKKTVGIVMAAGHHGRIHRSPSSAASPCRSSWCSAATRSPSFSAAWRHRMAYSSSISSEGYAAGRLRWSAAR
jgi:4-hydroxy-3-polyprenylbenzoate decarboxylase